MMWAMCARVERALEQMVRADDEGVHTAMAMIFVAAGRVA